MAHNQKIIKKKSKKQTNIVETNFFVVQLLLYLSPSQPLPHPLPTLKYPINPNKHLRNSLSKPWKYSENPKYLGNPNAWINSLLVSEILDKTPRKSQLKTHQESSIKPSGYPSIKYLEITPWKSWMNTLEILTENPLWTHFQP